MVIFYCNIVCVKMVVVTMAICLSKYFCPKKFFATRATNSIWRAAVWPCLNYKRPIIKSLVDLQQEIFLWNQKTSNMKWLKKTGPRV